MDNGKRTILLVDDDIEVRWEVGRFLTRAGYAVMACADGVEAVELLGERDFDAVICGIGMKGTFGLELIDWVRMKRPHTRLVVMTGVRSAELKELILSKGAAVYLEKPVDHRLLIEALCSTETDGTFWGTIEGIDILDYVQLMLLTGKEVVLEVRSRNGLRGMLYMCNGAIRHAVCGDLEGEEAAYCCMNFPGGSFANLPWQEPARTTISKSGDFLLIEAARRRDDTGDARGAA